MAQKRAFNVPELLAALSGKIGKGLANVGATTARTATRLGAEGLPEWAARGGLSGNRLKMLGAGTIGAGALGAGGLAYGGSKLLGGGKEEKEATDKRAFLGAVGSVLNPAGHVATRMLSDEGDPASFQTGERGAWTSLGRGITHGLAGGVAGGAGGAAGGAGIGALVSLLSRGKVPLGLGAGAGARLGGETGAELGSSIGGIHGLISGVKERAYKKPAGGEKKEEGGEKKEPASEKKEEKKEAALGTPFTDGFLVRCMQYGLDGEQVAVMLEKGAEMDGRLGQECGDFLDRLAKA